MGQAITSSSGIEMVRHKYQGFQSLLGENSRLLEVMADLEADLRFLPVGSASLEHQIRSLLEGTLLMIEDLNQLADNHYQGLYPAYLKIENQVLKALKDSKRVSPVRWLIPLSEIGTGLEAEVGGKAANLGEAKKIFPGMIPDGFAVTAQAYQSWISEPLLASEIRILLDTLVVSNDRERFQSKAARIREIIEHSLLPAPIQEAIQDYAESHWSASQQWAVRSSALGEDGHLSFAGQFESFLNIPTSQLSKTYQKVLASRFSERAISYRLSGGINEVETPMAVLFIPFIEASSAGVFYTRDPGRPEAEEVLISSTWGLAGDLVGGQAPADLFRVNRRDSSEIFESRIAHKKNSLAADDSGQLVHRENTLDKQTSSSLTPDEIARLMTSALALEDRFRVPLDMEWCIDHQGKIWILQVRPLRLTTIQETSASTSQGRPILSGGITIFPGRAIAPVQIISNFKELPTISEGVILVVPQAVPEIAAFLPVLAGFIAEQGHPTGHAATLLREFGVPSLFECPLATQKLKTGAFISLDATHREIFSDSIWPDIRERTLTRLAKPKNKPIHSPLHDLILNLKLTDPQSRQFRPETAQSIHDLIRFIHEKAIASLFEAGDRGSRKKGIPTHKLSSDLSFNLFVQDLGGGLYPEALSKKELKPEDLRSVPFQALWKGISHPRVSWSGRQEISLKGFASVMSSSLSQDMGAMRKLGDPNYLLITQDYLNLNIRLAYHYATIDSLIGPVTETNYVNFRFRGGGGSLQRRDLRARFLSEVLLSSRFSVDLRGDLVTAWLRGYPQQPSEAGLELLGKLMGCARQLDMLMENESSVRHYVERFLAGDYPAFA